MLLPKMSRAQKVIKTAKKKKRNLTNLQVPASQIVELIN
jgi:hypothetical protein